MKDKNLPDDIKNKSLSELTDLANNIIKNLENKNTLDGSIEEYQKLIRLNNMIEKKFQSFSPATFLAYSGINFDSEALRKEFFKSLKRSLIVFSPIN